MRYRAVNIWALVRSIDQENFGILIIGVFAATWLVSVAVYRLRRYDRLDRAAQVPVRTP
jgi:high-affinity nickel permease